MFWWQRQVRPGVSVAFTDTEAGNLALHVGDDPRAVLDRRARLEHELGLAAGSLHFMNQVHGSQVEVVPPGGRPGSAAPTADAMVSAGAALAVMVADCVPVVLAGADSDGRPLLGVVHAGRPGVANRVVVRAVEALRKAGATDLAAWVGPSVCGACYEVPASMREEVSAVEPAAWTVTRQGTPGLDLPAAVASQLEASGVGYEFAGGCTLEQERLFSHRRAAPTGRFAGVVWTHG